MPEFKQLAAGEKLTDPGKYLLIEKFCEPACGDQYSFSGTGCNLHSEYTYCSLEDACTRALALARTWDIPVIYLSSNCAPASPEQPFLHRSRKMQAKRQDLDL